jgi:hypothetical protein
MTSTQGRDSVELKLTVPEIDRRSTMAAARGDQRMRARQAGGARADQRSQALEAAAGGAI